jgi:hypothetical protein
MRAAFNSNAAQDHSVEHRKIVYNKSQLRSLDAPAAADVPPQLQDHDWGHVVSRPTAPEAGFTQAAHAARGHAAVAAPMRAAPQAQTQQAGAFRRGSLHAPAAVPGRGIDIRGDRGASTYQGSRKLFDRLLRDRQATMDNAPRFVQSMLDFKEKDELLQRLVNSSEHGARRLREAVAAGSGRMHFAAVTVRLLQLLVSPELNKPLYREGVLKLLRHVLDTPMLLGELQERAADSDSAAQATICAVLIEATKSSQDARRNPLIRDIAEALNSAGVPKAALLLDIITGPRAAAVQPQRQQQQQQQQQQQRRAAADISWAYADQMPGHRHNNDHMNYRDIKLLPTDEELACGESPYLPLANKATACSEVC